MSDEAWFFLFTLFSGLAGLLYIIQFAWNGVMSMIQTAPAGQVDTMVSVPRRRLFVTTAALIISLGFGAVGLYLSLMRADPATSVLYSGAIPTDPMPLFKEGQPVKLNISTGNRGPKYAYDVVWNAALVLHPLPVSSREEEEIFSDFRNKPHAKPPVDLPVGRMSWHTFKTRTLTSRDVQDLQDGRMALYLVHYVQYRDSNGVHENQTCLWLQPPKKNLVWHYCRHHNRIL